MVEKSPLKLTEFQVIEACVTWLHAKGWRVESVSLPAGQGLDPLKQMKLKMLELLEKLDASYIDFNTFLKSGPDIVAAREGITWKFECKGLGNGQPQTHINNFDRAVASVVSYFDSPRTKLGLGIANSYLWYYSWGNRLPYTLRKATNMSVFPVTDSNSAFKYPPSEESLPDKWANL